MWLSRAPGISVSGHLARIVRSRRCRRDLISWPPGRLAGRNTRGDDTALAIEHDNGLKATIVVVGIEQSQLLTAMNRV
jgi:hypothetical protein